MKSTALNVGTAIVLLLLIANHSVAQGPTAAWQSATPADWNDAGNWMFPDGTSVVPDASFDESAQISNGGTAIVAATVPDVVNLNVANGVLDVQNNGSLSMVRPVDTGGILTIGAAGEVRIAGNGMLTTEFDATNDGVLSLSGGNATLQIGDDFTNNGTLRANITGTSHSVVQVNDTATLGGSFAPSFTGVTPNFGDTWEIITAGSINGNFDSIDASDAPALPDGLLYQTLVDGNSLQFKVGNALILTIDRATGNSSVSNTAGGAVTITGYGILSQNGLLNAGGLSGLAGQGNPGWQVAGSNSSEHLAELNLQDSLTLNIGDSINLGTPYTAGPQRPSEEDVVFEYINTEGQVAQGIVRYEGPANDLVLNVDPETGAAAISNLSPFITPPVVNGYTVTSASGALNPEFSAWEENVDEAGEGWRKVNSSANNIGELNLLDSHEFTNGVIAELGMLFTPGSNRDLVFRFSTADGDIFDGHVEYGALPVRPDFLPADFNKDGTVDLSDFNILKGNFGQGGATMAEGDANMDGTVDLSDFNILKGSFGQSAAVPEPSAVVLTLLGCACLFSVRRSRILKSASRVMAIARRSEMNGYATGKSGAIKMQTLHRLGTFVAALTATTAFAIDIENFNSDGDGTRYTLEGRYLNAADNLWSTVPGTGQGAPMLVAIDQGDLLFDGVTPAPARRVGFWAEDRMVGSLLNADGLGLLDASVDWASPGAGRRITFVTGDGTFAGGGGFDAFWEARLSSQGHTVTGWDDDALPPLTSETDLIIISSTAASDPGEFYRDLAVPIINYRTMDSDNLGIAADRGDNQNLTGFNIADASHPLANGLSAGPVVMTTAATQFNTVTDVVGPGSLAPGAVVVGQLPGFNVNPSDIPFTGFEGAGYLAGANLDAAPAAPAWQMLEPVDVSGFTPELRLLLAARPEGFDPDQDFIRILADPGSDGTFEELIAEFLPADGFLTAPDGTGLTDAFQEFAFPLTSSGNLKLRIEAFSSAEGERLAIDHIRILPDSGSLLPGDFNTDGVVNLDDYNILLSNMYLTGDFFQGDNNQDGFINLVDFGQFRQIFNAANPAAAVPEPNSAIIALIGLFGVAILKRHKNGRAPKCRVLS